jgi:class 3 adenylate cyclase
MEYGGMIYEEQEGLDGASLSALATADLPEIVAGAEQDHVVMFTDLVGFTRITARTGSRATSVLLSRVLRLQISLIEAAGGTIRNIMGDAIMASWTVERAADKSATSARALRTAFAIAAAMQRLPSPLPRQQSLALRIGLHVGPALLGTLAEGHASGRTLIGDTVNIAARLQQARGPSSAAQPVGAVRVSAELYQALPAVQQMSLPARAAIRACGRLVRMHSGSNAAIEPTRRPDIGEPVAARPAHPISWPACLDRLADYLAAA